MSKNKIRIDKTCLNCNHVVEKRFCPNCGQENVESRKTFHQLFVHFFEDLTHYENSFWRTIKNLLLKPASLTKEYLSGKRMSYLAPIRLYIFISFVTFLVISLIPMENSDNKEDKKVSKNIGFIKITDNYEKEDKEKEIKLSPQSIKIQKLFKEGKLTKKEADTLISYAEKAFEKSQDEFSMGVIKFKSLKELDSIQKFSKDKMNPIKYWLAKKLFKATHDKTREEIGDKFFESFKHNLPKALFIYMPIFAFLLWLFHNKKNWYYFDHGIFTLHYFSFLLTIVLLYNVIALITEATFNKSISSTITDALSFIIILWFIFYFFRAHRLFYKETRLISRLKSITLFVLNLFFMTVILIFIILYSFINIH